MRRTCSKLILRVGTLVLLVLTFTATAQVGFKCNSSSKCEALVGYVPPNTTTLSNITTLFGLMDFHSLLGENSFPLSTPPNTTVAAKQTIKIPFTCSCSDGTGISDRGPIYKVKPGDFLDHIARRIFSLLVTYQQIAAMNGNPYPNEIVVGQELWIPLPCSCDAVDGAQVVHYGHVVQPGSSLEMIAEEFGTKQEILLKLNGLANPMILMADSILDVPIRLKAKKQNSSKIVIIVVIPSVITILSTITIWFFCLRRRKATKQVDDVDEIQSADSLQFNLSTIRVATNNFSDANKLGQGGFGYVYKGRLQDGQEIAVKRLSRNSGQGEQEFKNEVALVAKLQHRNLVRLLGFCIHGEERLLIYEFMPNASLDQFIFDPIKCTNLDWERRYDIIEGIARGLLYLHVDSRLRIIHRDLKASNVLLGEEMNPKISDFGMARMFMVNQTQASTNRIVGTYGYMAPEYAMHGQFSVKSDVFSFGVLVLEILSGQRNNAFYGSESAQDLLSYAWQQWKEGTALELLDPTLRENCSRIEVMRCIHIGLLCVQEDIADRPTMASIVNKLNNYNDTLQSPLKPPAFFVNTRKEHIMPLIESENVTVNEASITELYPR